MKIYGLVAMILNSLSLAGVCVVSGLMFFEDDKPKKKKKKKKTDADMEIEYVPALSVVSWLFLFIGTVCWLGGASSVFSGLNKDAYYPQQPLYVGAWMAIVALLFVTIGALVATLRVYPCWRTDKKQDEEQEEYVQPMGAYGMGMGPGDPMMGGYGMAPPGDPMMGGHGMVPPMGMGPPGMPQG